MEELENVDLKNIGSEQERSEQALEDSIIYKCTNENCGRRFSATALKSVRLKRGDPELGCPTCLEDELEEIEQDKQPKFQQASSAGYLDSVREQFLEWNKGEAEKEDMSSVMQEHRDKVVTFFDFYSQALNPPESYLQALEIAGKNSDHAWARVSGKYEKYCKKADNVFEMPEFDAGLWNPLYKQRSVRERTSRASGNFLDLLWAKNLAAVKPTFPKEISEDYRHSDDKEAFRKECWNTLKTFFHKLQDEKCIDDEKLGMHANLHLWKSSKPFKPHLHFHCAIPVVKAPYLSMEDRNKALHSRKVRGAIQYHEQQEKDTYEEIKAKRDIDNALAQELGVKKLKWADWKKGHVFKAELLRRLWKEALEEHWPEYMEDYGSDDFKVDSFKPERLNDDNDKSGNWSDDEDDDKSINIHISWIDSYKEPEKIVHKFRYKVRKPSIDIFRYYMKNDISMEEYEYADFLEHMFDYSNDSRNFGFMKRASCVKEYNTDKRESCCPICGGETRDVKDKDFSDVHGRKVVQERHYGFYAFDPPPDLWRSDIEH